MFLAQWSTTETGETRLRRKVVAESRGECREPRDRLSEPSPAQGRSQAPWSAQIVSMMPRESYHARESAPESSCLRETERRGSPREPSPARATSSCSRAHSRAQDTHPVSQIQSTSTITCARHTTYRRSHRAVVARRDKQRRHLDADAAPTTRQARQRLLPPHRHHRVPPARLHSLSWPSRSCSQPRNIRRRRPQLVPNPLRVH